MFAFDLKSLKYPLHTYKGFTGSLTDIGVDPTGKYVYTSSLDRYVRIHNAESTHLLYQCYVKSKATQILLKNADDQLLDLYTRKSEAPADQEYEDLFNKMSTVTDSVEEPEPTTSNPKKRKAIDLEAKATGKRNSGIKFKKVPS
jgi:ribosome biogenesis protein NSA1